MSEHMHWSEWLAQQVIETKKEPYVISGGMTTSGPSHLGTLCEFLFPSVIKGALEKNGKKCEYFFVADILDAFDSVPSAMEQFKVQLEPHLGKPLCDVPDPTGKSRSFGDHYLDEAIELMKKFGVNAKIVRINEYYKEGKFDHYAHLFLDNWDESKKIIEETSGKTEKKDWSPIMPLCEKCKRIATTRVTKYINGEYEYACDRDVKYTKGCGFIGKNKISDHRYKLVWRLHWPAWKQIFGTSIEGAGIDHHTKGGSEDTCRVVTSQLLKKDYHIPYRYGFILFQGKKYSKSKGIGMGVSDLIQLLPVEIIKYMLIKPDLEENIDINPTSENLLKLIEDFESSAKLDQSKLDTMSRHDRKRAIAFSISTNGKNVSWKSVFLDLLLYYQIYHNWNEVGKMVNDMEGTKYLAPYIEEWIKRDFIPEEYRFKYQPKKAEGAVSEFFKNLDSTLDALGVHNAIFEFAKTNGIEPKQFFAMLYQVLLGKEKGPRLGKLIAAIGIERMKREVS